MANGGALVNLGDLSKPATVLIEKISAAVGAIFEPHQIVRVARAEAEAEKVRALAQIEVTAIQQRALARMVQEEGKKQENIEAISAAAIEDLAPDAKPENLEADWLSHFFEKCKLVSDQEMQGVWSRLLAGEANSPGSYSKRTIELVSTLDKKDANLFTALCGFGWSIGGLAPLIYNLDDDIYKNRNITFDTLTHFETLGLLRFEAIGGFARLELPKEIRATYFSTWLILEFPSEKNQLEIGRVLLSKAGLELSRICGAQPIEGFIEYVVAEWASKNVSSRSLWLNPLARQGG